nr:MAG TPA: hypothetical protein [Caudoviricetes sp.]
MQSCGGLFAHHFFFLRQDILYILLSKSKDSCEAFKLVHA